MFVYVGVFLGGGECWIKNCLLAKCFWKEIQGILESFYTITKTQSFGQLITHEQRILNCGNWSFCHFVYSLIIMFMAAWTYQWGH